MKLLLRASRMGALLALVLLNFGLAGALQPAQAQFFGFWGYRDFHRGIGPRAVDAIVRQRGMRLISRPYRNRNVFVADAIDGYGKRQRFIIDADNGALLQLYKNGGERGRDNRLFPPSNIPHARVNHSHDSQIVHEEAGLNKHVLHVKPRPHHIQVHKKARPSKTHIVAPHQPVTTAPAAIPVAGPSPQIAAPPPTPAGVPAIAAPAATPQASPAQASPAQASPAPAPEVPTTPAPVETKAPLDAAPIDKKVNDVPVAPLN